MKTLTITCPACGNEIPAGHACTTHADSGKSFHFGCENRLCTFYKVIHNGDSCTWETRELAEDDIEENHDRFFEGSREDWRIEEVQMTWAQFLALGEHQGW